MDFFNFTPNNTLRKRHINCSICISGYIALTDKKEKTEQ